MGIVATRFLFAWAKRQAQATGHGFGWYHRGDSGHGWRKFASRAGTLWRLNAPHRKPWSASATP